MKYLKIDDVCNMLSISRRTLERMRAKGKKQNEIQVFHSASENILGNILPLSFPEPDLYIGRSPRWEEAKLIKWLQKNGSRLSEN